jgi:hypothetical protein
LLEIGVHTRRCGPHIQQLAKTAIRRETLGRGILGATGAQADL